MRADNKNFNHSTRLSKQQTQKHACVHWQSKLILKLAECPIIEQYSAWKKGTQDSQLVAN
ncbi:hypothetical protein A3843_07575 [Pseudovibrio exalbescens]|uniref:Uncharacterized protein n=1 Tax=Pseudovibrio exalbescens TaxID=197461 RepID=A0A1U7JHY4_9HYPH|nr:hypothetical protein A3843_07575 [Pseudovibrio exalbescens]